MNLIVVWADCDNCPLLPHDLINIINFFLHGGPGFLEWQSNIALVHYEYDSVIRGDSGMPMTMIEDGHFTAPWVWFTMHAEISLTGIEYINYVYHNYQGSLVLLGESSIYFWNDGDNGIAYHWGY